MSNYYTLNESYTQGSFKDVASREVYQFTEWFKTDPISDKNYIRANLAGFHNAKYQNYILPETIKEKTPEYKMVVPHAQFLPQDYPITYPCTTVYPKNTEYVKTKSIVLQP
jgi:hypothetical protein